MSATTAAPPTDRENRDAARPPGRHARADLPPRELTVDEYEDLVRQGVLTEDDKVELLEGWVMDTMPEGSEHSSVIGILVELLSRVLPVGWMIRDAKPIRTGTSELEPDLAVVPGRSRDYMRRHPQAGQAGLLIEVSDSSLRFDKVRKLRIYAGAGVPVYWVVNVSDAEGGPCIEVHTDPVPAEGETPARYRTVRTYRAGEDVPVVLAGIQVGTIPAAEVLP